MSNFTLSNIKIFGDPLIQFRSFSKGDTLEDILDKIKRPFITTQNIILTFNLNGVQELFYIDKGFIYDGATILKIFVPIIGESSDIRFMLAALIHDYFLNNKSEIYPIYFKKRLDVDEYIKLTTELFREILKQNHVSELKANSMANMVNTWQRSIFNKKMWSCLNIK